MANVRVTQIPTEVAISREFTSNARVTQLPVEVGIQRIFTSKGRITQLPIEVAVEPIYSEGVDEFTMLLIHADGENNSTTIIDEKYTPIEVYGNAHLDTDQFKFGESSIYIPGNGSYIKPLYSPVIGTGEFTIDGQVRYDNASRTNIIASYGGSNDGFVISSVNDNKLKLYAAGDRIVDTIPITMEEFFHVALVGDGGPNGNRYMTLYNDGRTVGSWKVDYNITSTLIFGANQANTNEGLLGHLDELRVSKTKRWTHDFTPPGKAYGAKSQNKRRIITPYGQYFGYWKYN